MPDSKPTIEQILAASATHPDLRASLLADPRVDHEPWPLRQATAESVDPGLVSAAGIEVEGEPVVHCSDGVRVRGFSAVPADRESD